ncbi:MAG: DegV family protein [Chloroflexi bacterium]|nr:DegV family protein [Chloroflexota bacterium]MBI1856238.1 DegV family protein [Chloroflexota bacterium]MBI3339855.1 DegV family protein [Chloroflexota bacterium]
MAKIAFVTDSTAYIPADLVKKYNITVAPQVLIWGEQTYQDGVDIQPDEFYTRLKTSKVMPTTSQVSIPTMQNIFQGLVEKGFDVIGVFISGKLSGTLQSAMQGRDALGASAEKVTVIDSNSTAMAMGFQVLNAARAAEQGASPADCKALVEKARSHTGVYFAVDTLEFLHRGGRIGGAQRFIGSALNLKPILALKDGRIEAEDRVRTKSKAVARVLELVAEQLAGKSNIHIATLHANAEAEARELLDTAGKQLNAVESVLSSVSPVVGTHAGPGTIGLAFMAGM